MTRRNVAADEGGFGGKNELWHRPLVCELGTLARGLCHNGAVFAEFKGSG
jgi:hypothetical protein